MTPNADFNRSLDQALNLARNARHGQGDEHLIGGVAHGGQGGGGEYRKGDPLGQERLPQRSLSPSRSPTLAPPTTPPHTVLPPAGGSRLIFFCLVTLVT